MSGILPYLYWSTPQRQTAQILAREGRAQLGARVLSLNVMLILSSFSLQNWDIFCMLETDAKLLSPTRDRKNFIREQWEDHYTEFIFFFKGAVREKE